MASYVESSDMVGRIIGSSNQAECTELESKLGMTRESTRDTIRMTKSMGVANTLVQTEDPNTQATGRKANSMGQQYIHFVTFQEIR